MNQDSSWYFDATSKLLHNSTCACSECGTAFCVSKRDHESRLCKECTNYKPFYFGKESLQNNAAMTDHNTKSSALKFGGLGVDSTEITNNILCKQSLKSESGVNDNIEDFPKASKEDAVREDISTTKAQLSAQIMNVSYKEFKESVSHVKAEKVIYNTDDIFKRIKEAYEACSCKICECITGKSILPPTDNSCGFSPCNCEPCNCKDCKNNLLNIGIDPRVRYFKRPNTVLERIKTGFTKQDDDARCSCKPCNCDACTFKNCNKELLNIAIESRVYSIKNTNTEIEQINSGLCGSSRCDCKPCDCIKCYKNDSKPCDCKPCQCYECKSMRVLGKKTVIVAPVGEGTQRANCLCAPCDCARCSHRGLNLSPNRVHEMSTGINRHPNCHCEACVDDSCEPNGTGSCRCEGRHGVISKPVENNPHDYDIRRANVSSKPMKSSLGNRFVRNSTFVAMNMNKFPPGNSKDFNKLSCKCSICECIVCKCKGNDFSLSKSSHNLDDSLRTLKLPSRELKNCQCSPCECEYCSMKKQAHFSESTEYKSCTCDTCDCLHCEGELKPRHTLSKLIPVMGMDSREMCRCKPCECNDCKKMATSRNDTCHCDVCQCERCADETNASHEAVYPIKKGEILTPSMIRKDPLSEPELLSQSSEYTHLKHSMAQSNVFNPSRGSKRSQQNFTIYHMVPDTNIKQSSFNPAVPLQSVENQRKLDSDINSKSKKAKILDRSKEDLKNWSQFYYPSTSKTVTQNEPSTVITNTNASHENDKIFESPINDEMLAISNLSRTPSLLSISRSTHNLVYLTPISESYHRTSCHLLIPSFNKNSENSVRSLRKEKEINYEKKSTEACNLKQNRCHHCGSSYVKSDIIKKMSNEITQTPTSNFTEYDVDKSIIKDTFLNYSLSNHSNSSIDNLPQVKSNKNNEDEKYESKNKYYAWRVEHPSSRAYSVNNVDYLLNNKSAPYERALMTLKRAKEFSLELVTLLEKYDKANLEFESISQKLKKSHESMFNEFKNDVYGQSYNKTKTFKNYDDYVNSNNEESQTIFINNNNSETNERFSSHNKEHLKTNVSLPLIVKNRRKRPDDKGNILKELNEFTTYEINKKESLNRSVAATLANPREKHVNVSENKSCNQFITSNNTNDLPNPHEGSVTKLSLSPTIDGKIELNENPDNMKKSPNAYMMDIPKAYKKIVKRSPNIPRKLNGKKSIPIDNGCDAIPMTNSEIVESNLLKTIIRQEIQTILKKFSEIRKAPTLSSSAEGSKARDEAVKRGKPIAIKYDQPVLERSRKNSTLTENEPIIKSKGSNDVPKYEAETPAAELSKCHNRNKALENLQNEVQELLNMAMLQTGSTDVLMHPSKEFSAVRSSLFDAQPPAPAPVVKRIDEQIIAKVTSKSKLKLARRRTINSTIVLANCPKSDSSVPVGDKKCVCEGMKATFIGLRRVSDHTVMVKWKAPKDLQGIQGFEVLVDGMPVERLFGPSDRMAVVTCLPHSERVQLAVRSVGPRSPCGHDPCRAALYRPRDK